MLPKRIRTSVKTFCAALLCLAFFPPTSGWTCTLFGAAGEAVAGGGTVLVKNRDWRPDHSQELALSPDTGGTGGYRFVGLYARGGQAPGLKAGVNQAGLTVVTATAGSIPREDRRGESGMNGILRRLLSQCASVEEAVARDDLFGQAKPCLFLLSDRREVARVEVAPGGRYAVSRTRQGVESQTNHYLEPALAAANVRIGASSRARADRIRDLLARLPRPTGPEAFLALARDTAGGPDDGIWRTGAFPGATRTLATFAVAMPPAGPGRLFVRLADPGQPERTVVMLLDDAAFAQGASRGP